MNFSLFFIEIFVLICFPFLFFFCYTKKYHKKIVQIMLFELHCIAFLLHVLLFLSCWLSFILMDMPQLWNGMEWQRYYHFFIFLFMCCIVLVQQYPNVTFRFHFNCSILWISKIMSNKLVFYNSFDHHNFT